MDNTKTELIELIKNLAISEEVKNELLTKIEAEDFKTIAKLLKNLQSDTDADVKSLDKMIGLIDEAKGEIEDVEDEAKRQIETIASEAEGQLGQLEEEAENLQDLSKSLAEEMEGEEKNKLRQKIEE